MIEYGVQRDGGLARLSVADDELALSSAYREEGIDNEQPRFHGGVHGFAVDDAGRGTLDGTISFRLDLTLSVHGLAQRIDHSAEEPFADGNARRLARTVDRAARAYIPAIAEDDYAARLGTQILHHAFDAALENHDLAVRGVI